LSLACATAGGDSDRSVQFPESVIRVGIGAAGNANMEVVKIISNLGISLGELIEQTNGKFRPCFGVFDL